MRCEQQLFGFCSSCEIEVFVAHHTTVGVVHHRAIRLLLIVWTLIGCAIAARRLDITSREKHVRIFLTDALWTGQIASPTRSRLIKRIQSFGLESFRSIFTLANRHLSTFSTLHFHVDGSHHSLTTIFIGSCLSMIEHPPLSIHLQDAAMRVAVWIGSRNRLAVIVFASCSPIDNRAAVLEWAQWRITISVCQSVVRSRQTELTIFCETGIDKHILVFDFPHTRRFKKAEHTFLIAS